MAKTIAELQKIREEKKAEMAIRLDRVPGNGKTCILLCGVAGCASSGSLKVADAFEEAIAKEGLGDKVDLIKVGCFGLCAEGPLVMTTPDHVLYSHVTPEDVAEIMESHIKGGKAVERLLAGDKVEEELEDSLPQIPFFAKQKRIALKNLGFIDPENIDEYIGMD